MGKPLQAFFKLEDFVPSLREAFQEHPPDLQKLIRVAVSIRDPKEQPLVPVGRPRSEIILSYGENSCLWNTDSLRALFRGNTKPPVLGDYPEAYNDSFLLLDLHALEISKIFGDRRDAEMLEIYSTLRRRPDGRTLGFVHDYMWQAAALVLGTRPLSQPEFEAIMARLERSCRTFQLSPGSRNYVSTLRRTIGRESGPV